MNSAAPNANPYFAQMLGYLTEVTLALFAAYDIPVELSEGPPPAGFPADQLHCMASIGYVGNGLRGVLALGASEATAKEWTQAAGVGDCDFQDTVGEFSNMLLGRLKAKLLADGIALSLATPITVSGAGLRVSIPPGHSSWQFFGGPVQHFAVRLDASFDSTFEVQRVDPGTNTTALAGDAILF